MNEFVRCCGGGWGGRRVGRRLEQRKDDLNEVTVGTLGGPCVVPTLESERFEPRKVRRRT